MLVHSGVPGHLRDGRSRCRARRASSPRFLRPQYLAPVGLPSFPRCSADASGPACLIRACALRLPCCRHTGMALACSAVLPDSITLSTTVAHAFVPSRLLAVPTARSMAFRSSLKRLWHRRQSLHNEIDERPDLRRELATGWPYEPQRTERNHEFCQDRSKRTRSDFRPRDVDRQLCQSKAPRCSGKPRLGVVEHKTRRKRCVCIRWGEGPGCQPTARGVLEVNAGVPLQITGYARSAAALEICVAAADDEVLLAD